MAVVKKVLTVGVFATLLVGGLYIFGSMIVIAPTNDPELSGAKPNVPSNTVSASADTIQLVLAKQTFRASVANTPELRKQGLSDTLVLPDDEAKLFIFDTVDTYSFWMKDMNYPIDIFWLDENKIIVHIEEDVQPDTYPTSFKPSLPALYVLETNAGIATQLGVVVGDTVDF